MSLFGRIPGDLLPEGTEFYCHECDHRIVKANDPKSGSFYDIFGHVWKLKRDQHTRRKLGNYKQVVFAICAECRKKFISDEKDLL